MSDHHVKWFRSVLFSDWVADLKTCLGMTDHVSCLVNIEMAVVHAELVVVMLIQVMILVLELAYQELLCLLKPCLR